MALWDDLIRHNSDTERDILILQEEIQARQRNGFVQQTDWWSINKQRNAPEFEELEIESFSEFLMAATIDVRHVAVLLSEEAHLDPYDLETLFQAVQFDGSSYLAHYVKGMNFILEGYYTSSSKSRDRFFVKDGAVDWGMSSFGEEDLIIAARHVGKTEQTFSFDCGRMQTLYAALEEDLTTHGLLPDWFIPSARLLPFHGVEPDCEFTFWDLEVYREPNNFVRPLLGDVVLPTTMRSNSENATQAADPRNLWARATSSLLKRIGRPN